MTSSSVSVPLKLRGSLTTPFSEDAHRAIRDALSGCENLVVDCSEAAEIDVSFLQLLASAERSAERAHKSIALAAPPQGVLADALRRCGFAPVEGATALDKIFPSTARGA
jgi:ABC-type transporter Mla MlaB component